MFGKLKKISIERAVNALENRIKYEYLSNALTEKTLNSEEKGVSSEQICGREIVVSLTTFGKRIYDVSVAIESIMQGTVKPNRILLWLDERMKDSNLPICIQKQCLRGLEVAYCKDIRSYTKLIPTLRCCPESVIVTIDDDILYSRDMLERLTSIYKMFPNRIVANRVHQIVLGKNKKPVAYNKWKWCGGSMAPSSLNFLTGVGGVLYPPHCFDEEVLNEDVFLDICKYADDIWFYAMALKNGTLVQKCVTHKPNGMDFVFNDDVQDVGLGHVNVLGQHQNDIQLKKVLEKYDLYEVLNRLK